MLMLGKHLIMPNIIIIVNIKIIIINNNYYYYCKIIKKNEHAPEVCDGVINSLHSAGSAN